MTITQKELAEMVQDSYRKGYLDGMNDRKGVDDARTTISPSATQAATQAVQLEPDILALQLGNLTAFDGLTAQEDIRTTVSRTRAAMNATV